MNQDERIGSSIGDHLQRHDGLPESSGSAKDTRIITFDGMKCFFLMLPQLAQKGNVNRRSTEPFIINFSLDPVFLQFLFD